MRDERANTKTCKDCTEMNGLIVNYKVADTSYIYVEWINHKPHELKSSIVLEVSAILALYSNLITRLAPCGSLMYKVMPFES